VKGAEGEKQPAAPEKGKTLRHSFRQSMGALGAAGDSAEHGAGISEDA
jgi:hypothetical protein